MSVSVNGNGIKRVTNICSEGNRLLTIPGRKDISFHHINKILWCTMYYPSDKMDVFLYRPSDFYFIDNLH